ncbi:hypothetical protein V8E36_004250 [Tilletia maclaganii]
MSISKGSSSKTSAASAGGDGKKPQYVKPPNPKPMARRNAQPAPANSSGLRTAQPRGLLLANNLPALQNLVKREPQAYIDDFRAQWNHFNALAAVLTSSSTASSVATGVGSAEAGAGKTPCPLSTEDQHKFTALLSFVTQLSPSFPKQTASLPNTISDLILHHHGALPHDIRRALLRSLILLRNRNAITSETLLRTLFPLLTLTTSAELRTSIQSTILHDIKQANLNSKNHRLNGLVQGILFTIVDDQSSAAQLRVPRSQPKTKSEALWAVRLAAQLWKKNIWNDAKTVSLLSLACFHHHPKVQSSAIRFFLGDLHSSESGQNADSDAEESEDDAEQILAGQRASSVSALMHKRKVNKKTRANDRKVKLASANAKRKARTKEAEKEDHGGGNLAETGNLAALHLLHDPQSFGEKLFKELVRGDRGGKGTSSGHHPIEMKVRIMQLLSRVMSAHKLCILGFYGYIVKYLNPHQQFITLILVSLAQSVHSQTPPTVLLSLVRKLADNFVHPGVSAQVNAAGLNSIREICRRQPSVMEEHDDGAADMDASELRGDDLDNVDADGNRIDIPSGPSVATSNKAKQAAANGTGVATATVSHTLTHGPTLLADLISYRKSKDKGVAAASRGLMQLYREVNPALLKRRERGKSGALALAEGGASVSGRKYGFGADDPDTVHGFQGLELLEKHLEEQRAEAEGVDGEEGEDDEAGWKGFELESLGDSDEESEGWIDVSSGGEDDMLNFDDSDIGSSSDDDDDEDREKRRAAKAAARQASSGADGAEDGPKLSAKERAKERREKRREDRQRKRRKLSRAQSTETGAEVASDDDSDDDEEGDSEAEIAADIKSIPQSSESAAEQMDAFSKLATTRILTPADLAKLAELRLAAAEEAAKSGGLSGAAARRQIKELQAAAKAHRRAGASSSGNGIGTDAVGSSGAILSESDILGPQKKVKADYEERIASIVSGREGREKFGSKKGQKKREKGASSTNTEKRKGKNFAMIAHSWGVRSKKKASLRDKSRRLRQHIDKAKKAYK